MPKGLLEPLQTDAGLSIRFGPRGEHRAVCHVVWHLLQRVAQLPERVGRNPEHELPAQLPNRLRWQVVLTNVHAIDDSDIRTVVNEERDPRPAAQGPQRAQPVTHARHVAVFRPELQRCRDDLQHGGSQLGDRPADTCHEVRINDSVHAAHTVRVQAFSRNRNARSTSLRSTERRRSSAQWCSTVRPAHLSQRTYEVHISSSTPERSEAALANSLPAFCSHPGWPSEAKSRESTTSLGDGRAWLSQRAGTVLRQYRTSTGMIKPVITTYPRQRDLLDCVSLHRGPLRRCQPLPCIVGEQISATPSS